MCAAWVSWVPWGSCSFLPEALFFVIWNRALRKTFELVVYLGWVK